MNFLKKKKTKRNKILMLVDWENISMNAPLLLPPGKFSIEKAFEDLIEKITQEVGAIVGIFVFVPSHQTPLWGEIFQRKGYFTVYCPKIKDKRGEERDTVDDELRRFGFKMLNQMPELTHLCLGSGDQDFIPLLQEAKHQGLKIILLTGDIQSLSTELIPFAEKKPDGKRRVYFLSSVEN